MSATPDPDDINSTARNIINGTGAKTTENAHRIHRALGDGWALPTKLTRDGTLIDVSEAMRLARDPEAVEEAYGHPHPFFVASLAGETYERGESGAVDALLERAAEPEGERAGPVDAGVVQSASPIQVDPVYVDIQQNQAPLLDYVTFESQAGFTAQYNIISDRAPPIGNVSESDALDLADNDKGDFTLGTKTREMGIYVDQIELSDFSQRATDSLGSGAIDIEETATGQRLAVHARFTAGELLYGDPSVGKSDGSIQDSNATPGLAKIASDRDADASDPINGHVIDKSGLSTTGDQPRLTDIKAELTDLVTNTGASYSDMRIVTSGELFDTLENEFNGVVRMSAFDEDASFGGRQINVKQDVPCSEVRAVGRTEHGQLSYNGTGDTPAGNFDPDPGDVFIYDTSAFRRRQLAPLSTVPLGRVGLADKAAMFEYKANIDKSHGAHVKYLQGYPTA